LRIRLQIGGTRKARAQFGLVLTQVAALHLGPDPEPVVEVGSPVAVPLLDAAEEAGPRFVEMQSQEILVGHLRGAGMGYDVQEISLRNLCAANISLMHTGGKCAANDLLMHTRSQAPAPSRLPERKRRISRSRASAHPDPSLSLR